MEGLDAIGVVRVFNFSEQSFEPNTDSGSKCASRRSMTLATSNVCHSKLWTHSPWHASHA